MYLLTLIGAAAMFAANPSTPVKSNTSTATCWSRWETTLHSGKQYVAPCVDVRVRVDFAGPKNAQFHTYAFWDGGDEYRLRAAFPKPGAWNWRTDCSDATNKGLHQRGGSVRVSAYRGKNALMTHGFPRVSADHRYLCQADGTPFLWIGDTAWAGAGFAKDADWAGYLRDRVAKRFTVIQVGTAQDWGGPTDALGNPPFLNNDVNQPNPAFWRGYEQRIQAANDAGMVVMLVGLMEPRTRYPSVDTACAFARYLVARLHGNAVIFSPSFDSVYMEMADRVGEAVRDATHVHLITQHPGTPCGDPTQTFAERYFDQTYMDFSSVQSGHNEGNREKCARQAMEWNLHLYRRQPTKPIVNLEAMYDTEGRDNPIAFTGDDSRSLGWRSLLSGAVGYTYGTEIYLWHTDPAKPDYWRRTKALPSSDQITHLHDFFCSLPWWKLTPAPERVLNQPSAYTLHSCFALTADMKTGVAYLPADQQIELDMTGMRTGMRARWYNPRVGKYVSASFSIAQGTTQHFNGPGQGDWVLLITSK